VFDNEVMTLYRRLRTWLVAPVAAIGGVVLGVVIGWFLFRRRPI
jgi:ABC-type branched-subunit amino acid transport system permease subunit